MKQLIFLFCMLFSNGQIKAQQNTMPQQRPTDFTLSYRFHGGMIYHIEDITITSDSCIYMQNQKGHVITHRFKLSTQELDSLYTILQQNQFTQIKYGIEGKVYDRGGISIDISWNNSKQRYTVNDSGSSFVSKEWKSKWFQVVDYVENLRYKK